MSVFSNGLLLGFIVGFVLGCIGGGLVIDDYIKAGAFQAHGQAYRVIPMDFTEVRK